MHRGGIATRIEIEVRVFRCRAIKHESLDETFAISVGLRREFKLHITSFRDFKFAKRSHPILHRGLMTCFSNSEPEFTTFVTLEFDRAAEFAGRFDLAEPQHLQAVVLPL